MTFLSDIRIAPVYNVIENGLLPLARSSGYAGLSNAGGPEDTLIVLVTHANCLYAAPAVGNAKRSRVFLDWTQVWRIPAKITEPKKRRELTDAIGDMIVAHNAWTLVYRRLPRADCEGTTRRARALIDILDDAEFCVPTVPVRADEVTRISEQYRFILPSKSGEWETTLCQTAAASFLNPSALFLVDGRDRGPNEHGFPIRESGDSRFGEEEKKGGSNDFEIEFF